MILGNKSNPKKYFLVKKLLEKTLTNRDGFFIATDEKSIRTLDLKEYRTWIRENKDSINNSKTVAGHFRIASSGGVEKKWVHGWKFGSYFGFHNGVSSGYTKTDQNDSYEFFEDQLKVKSWNSNKPGKKTIEKAFKKVTINGAFFLVDPHGYKVVFNKNHDVYCYLIDKEIQLVTSQKVAISDLKGPIKIQTDRELAIGRLTYFGKASKTIANPLANSVIYSTDMDDNFLLFDKDNVCIENKELTIQRAYTYSYKRADWTSNWYKDNGYFID
jgi:hypothetical protein